MIKLLSLFSGIGAFEKALDNIGVDKYASKSYSLIHNVDENKNLIDVTNISTSNLPNDIDLITYGFPCQDISVAGKQKGFFDKNGKLTRSGLFFEALRIINDTKPKIAIAENVKNLTSSKFADKFGIILNALEEAGYNNYWKVLNARDYDIPQNRERVFIVSIRKDIDNGLFTFPDKVNSTRDLFDTIDEDVDEKYFFSDTIIKGFMKNSCGNYDRKKLMEGLMKSNKTYASTITTREGWRLPCTFIKYINGHVINKKLYPVNDNINLEALNDEKFSKKGTCNKYFTTKENGDCLYDDVIRLRKLTPLECMRLMGFEDSDYEKIKDDISMTQIYKQAGNSIVVNVLEALFTELFKAIEIKQDHSEAITL